MGQQLLLSSSKALYWVEQSMLLVSDVHFGKAAHFRKSGIAVPASIHHEELSLLEALICQYRPKKLVILGDLFHSDWNTEWSLFSNWVALQKNLKVQLIKGNHDILPQSCYSDAGIEVFEKLRLSPFSFTHEAETVEDYSISGHIHPSVRLKGNAKQGMRLPCFYFGKKSALMPAFGNFTGTANIKIFRGDQVFAITPERVISLSI